MGGIQYCCHRATKVNCLPDNQITRSSAGKFNIQCALNSVYEHALLSMVGNFFTENSMGLGTGLPVLHMLVSLSAGSDLAKLHFSKNDQHRGKGCTVKKHGLST